jgi:cytochrome c oxidase subunit IV
LSVYAQGLWVAVLLAIMTVLEYIFAAEASDETIRFIGLGLTAIAKAGLIAYVFMHIYQVWRAEGAH